MRLTKALCATTVLTLSGLHTVAAAGYDLGGDEAICWLTMITLPASNPNATIPPRVQLANCPPGTSVEYEQDQPNDIYDGVEYTEGVAYTMTIKLSGLNESMVGSAFVTEGCDGDSNGDPITLGDGPFTEHVMDEGDDGTVGGSNYEDGDNDIGHANIHSCSGEVGFCVPFIGNDGNLATHTGALKGSWVWNDDGDEASALFESDPILNKGVYTMIAHGRFQFYGADGALWRMDMAKAYLGLVVHPVSNEIELDTVAVVIGQVVAIISLIFLFVLLWFTIAKRQHKIMMLSQSPILIGMAFTGIIAVAWTFSFADISDEMCQIRGFAAVPLTFMVGLLYGKVKRVIKVTQATKRLKVKVTPLYVVAWASALTLPQLILWLASFALDPMEKTLDEKENGVDFEYICDSDSFDVFATLIMIYSFFVLLVGAYTAYLSANLPSSFNESHHIATAMYSVSLLSFITVPIIFAVDSGSAKYVVSTLSICMAVNVTNGIIIIPKAKLIMNKSVKVANFSGKPTIDDDMVTSTGPSTGSGNTTTGSVTVGQTQLVVKNYYRNKDLKEDAMEACDHLSKEVANVKDKYDNMFTVEKDDMKRLVRVIEKLIEIGTDPSGAGGDTEPTNSSDVSTT